MSATARRIFHFDLEVKRRGHTTYLPPLTEIISVWKERADAKTASQIRQKGDLKFNIEEVEIYDEGIAVLLLSVVDKNAPNSVYQDFLTQQSIINKKSATQGGMISCHIAVSLYQSKADTYACTVESAVRLNTTNIEGILNRILHDEYDVNPRRFNYKNPAGTKDRNGNVKRTNFLPRIELKGHISDEMLESLQNGRLTSVMLVDDKEKSDFGDSPYLVQTENHIVIKPKPNLPKQHIFETITAAARTKSKDFKKARIRFVDPNGQSQNIEFNTEDGSIVDPRFVKSEWIEGIAPPLDAASSKIISRVARPMMRIVKKLRGDEQ